MYNRYVFKFGEVLDVSKSDECDFILSVASIANDVQLVRQLLQSTLVDDNTPESEGILSESVGVYYLRLAALHLHAAAVFFNGHSRLFQDIDPRTYGKYLKRRQRKDRLFDKLLEASDVRNNIAHYGFIDKTNYKSLNKSVAIFEKALKMEEEMSAETIIHGTGHRFVFLDEFQSSIGELAIDPSMTLSDGERVRKFTSLYVRGLEWMERMSTEIVVEYIVTRVNRKKPLKEITEEGQPGATAGEESISFPRGLAQSVRRVTGKSSLDEAVSAVVRAYLSGDK